MFKDWFANPGQVIQIVLAAVGVGLTAKNAYPDFKADQLFSLGTFTFYVLIVLFVVMAVKLVRSASRLPSHNPNRSLEFVPTAAPPSARVALQEIKALTGTEKKTSFDTKVVYHRFDISLGDIREIDGLYGNIEVEFRDIKDNTDKKPGESEHGAVFHIGTGGGLVYGGGRTKQVSTNCYFVPFARITQDEEEYSIISFHYSERHLSLFVLYLNHINIHSNTATLTVLITV